MIYVLKQDVDALSPNRPSLDDMLMVLGHGCLKPNCDHGWTAYLYEYNFETLEREKHLTIRCPPEISNTE